MHTNVRPAHPTMGLQTLPVTHVKEDWQAQGGAWDGRGSAGNCLWRVHSGAVICGWDHSPGKRAGSAWSWPPGGVADWQQPCPLESCRARLLQHGLAAPWFCIQPRPSPAPPQPAPLAAPVRRHSTKLPLSLTIPWVTICMPVEECHLSAHSGFFPEAPTRLEGDPVPAQVPQAACSPACCARTRAPSPPRFPPSPARAVPDSL